MPERNREQERERLRAVYAPMTDAELREVADDADFLTEVARAIPRAEEAPTERNWDLGKPEPPAAKPVIVARYRDLHLATVMNSLPDSAGIEGFLADDRMIRPDWLIERTRRYQGVDAGNHAREARAQLAPGIPETFEVEGIGPYQLPKCPNCGSLHVPFEELDRKIAHRRLLMGIPIPAVKHGWNCHGCGHSWEGAVEPSAE